MKLGISLDMGWIPRHNGFDPDAQAVIDAILAESGVLTDAKKLAIVNLVSNGKSSGWWQKSVGFFGYAGGNAAAHGINWINPSGTRMSWTGLIVHNDNGIKGDGGAFGDTGITAQFLGTRASMSYYQRTHNSSGSLWRLMGETNAFSSFFMIDRFEGAGNTRWLNGGGTVQFNSAEQLGLVTASCIGDTDRQLYFGPTSVASDATGFSGSADAINMFVLAANTGLGSYDVATDANFAMHNFLTGLTAAEMVNYDADITAYQTAMGRNV